MGALVKRDRYLSKESAAAVDDGWRHIAGVVRSIPDWNRKGDRVTPGPAGRHRGIGISPRPAD